MMNETSQQQADQMLAADQNRRRTIQRLKLDSCVHHIDGDPRNNSPENLIIVRASDNRRPNMAKLIGRDNFANPAEADRYDARKHGKSGPILPMEQERDSGRAVIAAGVLLVVFMIYLWNSWG